MTHYDYKVVPAPKRAKKVKGVRGPEDLFAMTMTDAINEVARQGWEYVRAEHLPAEAPGGWFRSAKAGEQTVLVFRRARETLGPRLASVRPEPDADIPAPTLSAVPAQERAVIDRMQQNMRLREPPLRLEPLVNDGDPVLPTPLRPSPRLGPADKS